MEYMILWSLLLIYFLQGVWSEIKLEQSASEVKRPGERVKMLCTLSGYSLTSYNIFWIRQRPGRALEWIGYMSTGNNSPGYSVQGRFIISRDDSSSKIYLQMNSLKTEDTAVYYCARRSTVRDSNRNAIQKLLPLFTFTTGNI
uniref:Ig-like domain-containing protein n=1 Tax=Maylandia zebra TaxID=106582 RepID=A0A3P9BSM4_9CICH